MSTVKAFTKMGLIAANEVAIQRNYNRQLDKDFVKNLPEGKWYPIIFNMFHEHAQGKKVDPHVRCQVVFNVDGDTGFIDVDLDTFRNLYSFDMDERKAR